MNWKRYERSETTQEKKKHIICYAEEGQPPQQHHTKLNFEILEEWMRWGYLEANSL